LWSGYQRGKEKHHGCEKSCEETGEESRETREESCEEEITALSFK
jgi:hypothetical protein